MQTSVRALLFSVIFLMAPTAVWADFFDQLNGVGVTATFGGSTSALSQYDTNPVTAPDLPLAAIAFDNFTLTNGVSSLDTFSWTGTYEDDAAGNARATAFQISFYHDNAGAVGALRHQFVAPIASVNETSNGGDHYAYTFTAPAGFLTFDPGVQYWVSVVAELPYNFPGPNGNAWGWAFNNSGVLNSWQYTQTGPEDVNGFYEYEQFNDPINYSFSIQTTAVPEPSSCLLLAGAIGGMGIRKWRKRRSVAGR